MVRRVALFALLSLAIVGIFFRRYVVAYIALNAGEKMMYISDSRYRDWITPKVISAKSCLAHYRELDPAADAEAEAKKPVPRFYYHFFNGYSAGVMGTGLPDGCDPDLSHMSEPGWQPVNQYDSVTGDGDYSASILENCNIAAQRYAGRFNKRLAALRSDRVPFACAHRVTPEQIKQMMDQWRVERKKELARVHSVAPDVVRHSPADPPLPPVVAPPPVSAPSR